MVDMNSKQQQQTLQAWKSHVAGNHYPADVPSLIVESWERSYRKGLNPYSQIPHAKLGETALRERLAEKRELIDIVRPFMENLYKFVKGTGFVVVLTDECGYIIEMLADENMLNNPMTGDFFIGSCWQEEVVGTNAIGTALVIEKPIQVSGAEHYSQKHHCLTCSAAPVFDANGKLVAVLDISGASYLSHLHTLGMVVAASESITSLLKIQWTNRELAITNERMSNIFNTMTDGVILIDGCGKISQMNPSAQKLFNVAKHEFAELSLERLFGVRSSVIKRMLYDNEAFEDVELIVEFRCGTVHCFISGRALTDGKGNVIGGVIILNPITHLQKLVNHFGGYYASLQFSDIVAESEEMKEAVRVASLAATTYSNILLHGESGTGKEIFAQAIHNRSRKSTGPFLALNCGIIPRELIGSELFGYSEGAFTGAKRGGKPGKFELASGGTLFLDEIGDMPLEQQIALLRVLQEKKVTRLGSEKVIPVDVRIICATNKNLLKAVENGTFRQDLYYRLNVISISLPPLRTRVQDISLLFKHFLDKMGKEKGHQFVVEQDVIGCLEQYPWPGNVRELQNLVERVVSLSETPVITKMQLPPEFLSPGTNDNSHLRTREAASTPAYSQYHSNLGSCKQWRQQVEELERQRILLALIQYNGNISSVAKVLGISRNTLYRKMKTLELQN